MPVSTLDNFYTLNHEYTFSGNTAAVGDNADLFHLSTFPPVQDTLLRIPQSSWTPGKTVRIWVTFQPAEDALPSTRRLLNTWKSGFAITTSQC